MKKFYETNNYKDVRRWLDNSEIEKKINIDDDLISDEEEKVTDFLNFFEFIANLETERQILIKDVTNLFDYYLRKIKASPVCMEWIKRYGFEKLSNLLKKLDK